MAATMKSKPLHWVELSDERVAWFHVDPWQATRWLVFQGKASRLAVAAGTFVPETGACAVEFGVVERDELERIAEAHRAARLEHPHLVQPPPTAAKPERSLPQPIGHVMQFFRCEHLPAQLREVSEPFCELASWLVLHCPHNPELTVALRKLLEGKDAAVRAVVAG